jgi:hypothetical protein
VKVRFGKINILYLMKHQKLMKQQDNNSAIHGNNKMTKKEVTKWFFDEKASKHNGI